MRCMTAFSGLTFCGGHGKKYAETVEALARVLDPEAWRKQPSRWGSEVSGRRTASLLDAGNVLNHLAERALEAHADE